MQSFGEGRSPLDLGIEGWVILQCMLKNRMGDRGLSFWFGMATGGGLL
jgi:hypothetical protein